MNIDLGSGEVCLRPGQLVRIAQASGLRIRCMAGTIWITVAGEPLDVILAPGLAYRITSQGLTLIESIGEGRVRLEMASSAHRTGRWRECVAARITAAG